MIKTTIGLIAISAVVASGCGDSSLPTESTSARPTPTSLSLAPIVERVDRGRRFYSQWIFRGRNLGPDPIATFESAGSVIRLDRTDFSSQDDSVSVLVPWGTAPGAYTPCVRTVNGKGCGNFLVTVTR